MSLPDLSHILGKKDAADPIEQRHQSAEKKSLSHYRSWPVFLVYQRRRLEQIVQAIGDISPRPTLPAVEPGPITPEQLLTQIDKEPSQVEENTLLEEEDWDTQLLSRIEAAAAGSGEIETQPDETDQPAGSDLSFAELPNDVGEKSPANITDEIETQPDETDQPAGSDFSFTELPNDVGEKSLANVTDKIEAQPDETDRLAGSDFSFTELPNDVGEESPANVTDKIEAQPDETDQLAGGDLSFAELPNDVGEESLANITDEIETQPDETDQLAGSGAAVSDQPFFSELSTCLDDPVAQDDFFDHSTLAEDHRDPDETIKKAFDAYHSQAQK